jgi:hypothetical protein
VMDEPHRRVVTATARWSRLGFERDVQMFEETVLDLLTQRSVLDATHDVDEPKLRDGADLMRLHERPGSKLALPIESSAAGLDAPAASRVPQPSSLMQLLI